MPYIDDKEEKDILIIRSIDANFKINGPLHYTSRYEVMTREIDPQLVVRRGQPFVIDMNLSRPFKEEQDAVSFIFTVEGTISFKFDKS